MIPALLPFSLLNFSENSHPPVHSEPSFIKIFRYFPPPGYLAPESTAVHAEEPPNRKNCIAVFVVVVIIIVFIIIIIIIIILLDGKEDSLLEAFLVLK